MFGNKETSKHKKYMQQRHTYGYYDGWGFTRKQRTNNEHISSNGKEKQEMSFALV